MTDTQREGGPRRIIVVSAPSGAGKGTVLARALADDPSVALAVSCTTRPPRTGEVDGTNYYFLTRDAFEARIAEGAFAEWAEVHGNLYGTLKKELERWMASGKDVVLEVDVQGMRQVRNAGLAPVTVFITVPDLETLRRRIESRGQNTPEDIALRLANAEREMAAQDEYDTVIVNDTLDEAVAAFHAVLRDTRRTAD